LANPVKDQECPDFVSCLGSVLPGIEPIGQFSDGNNKKSSGTVKCGDDYIEGNDGRSFFKVTCGCNSANGCRWVWKDNKIRECIPKSECPGVTDITWGGMVGSRIIGKDGVHLNTRMYYQNANGETMDSVDKWTLFLMVDKQLHSKIGNLTYSANSLLADYVGHYVEDDCSSTIFQFQSGDFHGSDFNNRKRRALRTSFNKQKYHQVQIDLRHLDLWQLGDDVTQEKVYEYFDNVKLGWMSGHHPDITYCVGKHYSARPPFAPEQADAVEYPNPNPKCKPQN